jgi:transcriptional regulator GlxA family with amidase domain
VGVRGRRSAADLATTRPDLSINLREPIDIAELARQHGTSRREAERLVRRAERHGEAVSRIAQDGHLEWFWTE